MAASAQSRLRMRNPHLGAYYGIITSAFVSLIILLAIFEELGFGESFIGQIMILAPLGLYLLIGVGARTLNPEEFYASGRRVPAVFNGFVLAATAIGGAGFLAYTGTLLFLGFDALAIGLGWTVGLLAAAVLFVPYLRKGGAYTLPSFIGHRFRSRTTRVVASGLQLPPTALLLAAEIKIAALVATLVLPLSFSAAVLGIAALIAAIAMLGGMRALTWSGSAQFLVCAVGLTATLTIVSVLLTNLPAPQFTYGGTLPALQNAEITAGLSPLQQNEGATPLPEIAPERIEKPFMQPFGLLDRMDFIMLFLCIVLGTAALPSLLARSGVTNSVADQRRSMAWGLLFVALFAITAPAIAVFTKLLIFQDIAQASPANLPAWFTQLSGRQLVQVGDANGDGNIDASELLIARDGIALALPMLAKLPYVCTVLLAAAAMAIALAAAGSHLFTLGASLAEDLYRVLDRRPTLPWLIATWAAIAATALAAAVFLVIAEVDPLRGALTAFALAGATFFPVLLLGIWWRRCTAFGALAAMGTGFVVTLLEVVFGSLFGSSEAGVTTAIASLIGVVLALAAGIAASLYGPRPSEAEAKYWADMRNLGSGEAIYDRVQQRAAAASVGSK